MQVGFLFSFFSELLRINSVYLTFFPAKVTTTGVFGAFSSFTVLSHETVHAAGSEVDNPHKKTLLGSLIDTPVSLDLVRTLWTWVQMFLNTVLVVLTDLAARFLGNTLFRQHFHLLLSAVMVFGPALSLWVSQHSIFAKRSHFLYRLFLCSGWGWTCIFVGSFVFLLSFSIRRSLILSLRHLSRLAVAGGLWLGFCKLLDLLENTTGSCYESLHAGPEVTSGQPLLVLREGESKYECLKAGMVWRGYEVSEDTFLLCLCCLLLVEETAVFGPYLSLGGISDAPLRILFLLCVLLLGLWIFLLLCLLAYFPQFPTQLLGGALGCLVWRGLYQGWYRMGPSWYCPGRPGHGLLNTKTGSTDAEDAANHNHYS